MIERTRYLAALGLVKRMRIAELEALQHKRHRIVLAQPPEDDNQPGLATAARSRNTQ